MLTSIHSRLETSDQQWFVCMLCALINWRAPWKNRIYWCISFFCPSLHCVLFPMFCLLVEGECQILVF